MDGDESSDEGSNDDHEEVAGDEEVDVLECEFEGQVEEVTDSGETESEYTYS